jgi:hypothetical protein
VRLISLIGAAAISAAGHVGFAMNSLEKYEWKNRVVIVFGHAEDYSVVRQVAVLTSRPEALQDRDMVVLQVDCENVRPVYGIAADISADKLRRDLGVETNRFKAVLVGKDGTTKLDSSNIVSAVEMFALIDQMPMRRSERHGG